MDNRTNGNKKLNDKNKGKVDNQEKKWIEFDFKEKGFLENGVIREELLAKWAKDIAQNFIKCKLTSTQLRAFFFEVKGIKNRIDKEEYKSIFPLLLLLKAKVEYKAASNRQKIPEVFKNFLVEAVDRLQKDKEPDLQEGKKAFLAFVMFFEAIVGYFYGLGGRSVQGAEGQCTLHGAGEGVMACKQDVSKNNSNMLFILSPQASKIFK